MKNNKLIVFLIFFLAFILRFIYLGQIPAELNRDEVSVGFNAYSLLKTGRDEHGRGPWPLVFKAFGDYKIPGYIYLVLPVIKFFGLNAFSVRLPAAFFGFLTIIVLYFFIKELFPKNEWLAIIACFILAIAPFHLHYSRQQFEATVALFFTLMGLLCLLKARKNQKMLIFSLLAFLASFFTYNTSLFITLPLILWTFYVYRQDFLVKKKATVLNIIFVFLIIISLLGYWNLVKEGNRGRTNTTIFNQIKTKEEIDSNLFLLNKKGSPLVIGRFFNNKLIFLTKAFIKNYLAAFNPKFIFITSDNNYWHSLGYLNFGNILIILLPFILMGIFKIFINFKEKHNLWLIGYLFITPIANGLTIDSPILTRLLDFHLVLIVLAGLGLEQFLFRQKKNNLKNILFGGLFGFSICNYLLTYFLIFPQSPMNASSWLTGIREVCQIVAKEEQKYDYIFLDSNVELGYIFFAFYFPFPPVNFQREAVWKFDGFDKVYSYKKYYFGLNVNEMNNFNNLKDIIGEGKSKNILLIEKITPEISITKEDNKFFIYDSFGKPIWQLKSIII